MKNLYQCSSKSLVGFAIIILLGWSCKEDKVDKKNAKEESFVLTIDATSLPTGIYYPGDNNYIIISDGSGNTVAFSKIKAGQKYDLPVDGVFDDGVFTLSEVSFFSDDSSSGSSAYAYMGLPIQNTTWTPKASAPAPANSQLASFTFSNQPRLQISVSSTLQAIQLAAPSISPPPFPPPLPVTTNLVSTKGTYIMASSPSGAQLRYKLFTNNNAGYSNAATNVIDLSLMTDVAAFKAFTPSPGSIAPLIGVDGILRSGVGQGTYTIFPYTYFPSAFQIPDLGTLFDDYFYKYTFMKGNHSYTNCAYSKIDTEPMAATISSKSKSGQSITYTTTGVYDYDRFYANNSSAGASGSWVICAPPSTKDRTVMIPTLPSEITSKWPIAISTNYQLRYFQAVDIKSIVDYQDFFNHRVLDYDDNVELKLMHVSMDYL